MRNWLVMNSNNSVPIRVLASLMFLHNCGSSPLSLLAGFWHNLGLPGFLFQLPTLYTVACTLSRCSTERRLCRAWHLTKCKSFLRINIIHFCWVNSEAAACVSPTGLLRGTAEHEQTFKKSNTMLNSPMLRRVCQFILGRPHGAEVLKTLQQSLCPNLKYFCFVLYQVLRFPLPKPNSWFVFSRERRESMPILYLFFLEQ